MGSFIVTTDSGCDLPLSFCSSRGIIPLKMNYAIGDKNYTDTMDPKDLKSFYDGMRSGDTPKTSQVTPYQFTEFWTPLLEKKQPLIHIALGSGISGTWANAVSAADMLMQENPGANTGQNADKEAAAVFHASAVFVGALVCVGTQKLLDKVSVRCVDLNAVCAGKLGVYCCLNVSGNEIVDIFNCHFTRENGCTALNGVQLNARRHGLTAAVACRRSLAAAVMQLDEYFRAVAMHRLADKLKALDLAAVVYTELYGVAVAAVGIDGGEFGDDKSAAALGAVFVKTDLLGSCAAVPVAHESAHGGHNDAVAKLNIPDLAGLKKFFVFHKCYPSSSFVGLTFVLSETDAALHAGG